MLDCHCMAKKNLVRTTVRLKPELKKAVDQLALDRGSSAQEIINRAVDTYLDQVTKQKVKQINFDEIAIDLGVPLDNLTREDYYPEPDMEKYVS